MKQNKYPILIFFFLVGNFSGYTQNVDTLLLFDKILIKIDSVKIPRLQSTNTDSVKIKMQIKKDSLQAIKSKITSKLDSLDPRHKISQARLDTLNPQHKLTRLNNSVDSMRTSLSTKVDSLTKLNVADSSINRTLANLKSQIDSLKNIGPLEDVNNAYQKIGKAQSQLNEKIKGVETEINSKLGLFNKNGAGGGQLNLPGVNAPSLSLKNPLPAGIDTKLPTGSLGSISPDLPALETGSLPGIPKTDTGLHNLNGPGQNLTESVGKAGEITKNVSGYQEDIKNINSGNLDKVNELPGALESKVNGFEDVAGAKEQMESVTDYKAMIEKWNSDPDVAKERALNKAKQEAVNHFAGHEEELKAAMAELSKLKAKLPDTEGVVDLFAKRQNPMKDKSLIERLVPGLSLQFQKQESFWLDLNPHIAYKISGRFVAGLGWNERLAYDFDKTQWDAQNHIYGLRGFVHFKLKTNFWLKGEAETMNSPIRATPLAGSDIVSRAWVASYFGGIKKDFQITKHLKGNVQMLYNLYNPEKKSPYANRVNVRMGIELPLKKKSIVDGR